ncbi:DUF4436 family protein [Herbiconiux sp. KACC 21604]|uniref:DUF4436 family protein n=1 Tax=unclassified Herbiconiux TaxID=2618217 RepID=UPI001490AEFA|nr:DUF4436 family protein [Herbiconiux sp. SALV-R1]QJU52492.1 DUF4436 family protein [Herbiconiux sp. SALV-R1]WPO87366.1 DUF4436 family protein [Herbiconiux sp. KACC 21604]
MSALEPGGTEGVDRAPRPRRRLWLLISLAALGIVVYLLVVALYASSGARSTMIGDPTASDSDVDVTVSPLAVNGAVERLSLDISVEAPDSLIEANGVAMKKQLLVLVTPVDGAQTVALDKGSIPRITKTTSVVAGGSVENWPFDRYSTGLLVVAYTVDAGGNAEVQQTNVMWKGYLSGWNFAVSEVVPDDPVILEMPDGSQEKAPLLMIEASRSGSTLAFGVLLLSVLVVMPVLVLFVAISAFTGRRKVEATLMSWMGAMLFATIPLRGFLPGSPPIGSWIDFLIVLWVIVALVAGLAVYVAAWSRWGTRATPKESRAGRARRQRSDDELSSNLSADERRRGDEV